MRSEEQERQQRWEAYATKAGFLDDKSVVLPGQHERAATSWYTWEACEKALARAPDAGEADVWPIVRVVVKDDKIVSATQYAPGLPDGEHDVYPVRITRAEGAGEAEAVAPIGSALTGWAFKEDADGWRYFGRPDGFRQAITPSEPLGSHAETLYMLLGALSPTPSDNRQQYAKEGESGIDWKAEYDGAQEVLTEIRTALNASGYWPLGMDLVASIRGLLAATPAVAVQAEPEPSDEQIRKVYKDACDHAEHCQQGFSYGRMQALRAVFDLGRGSAHPKPAAQSEGERMDDLRALASMCRNPPTREEAEAEDVSDLDPAPLLAKMEAIRATKPAAPATADDLSEIALTAAAEAIDSEPAFVGGFVHGARHVLALRSGASAQHAEGGA